MSSISTWVLSIAGIICISVLLELVMPEGQMNKYIKNIFSFVIILVIILPLPKLMNKNIDLSSMFQYQEIQLQEDFLEEINGSKLSSLQKTIEKDLSDLGYTGIKISISADIFDEKIDYKRVYVNLKNLVITEDAEHKDILEIKEEMEKEIEKHLTDVEVYFEE